MAQHDKVPESQKRVNRTVRRTVRFTPEEWEMVARRIRAKRMKNFSSYARSTLANSSPTVRYVPQYATVLARQIAAIGNNFNQIAKYVNTNHAVAVSELSQAKRHLANIEDLLRTFQNSENGYGNNGDMGNKSDG